MTDTIINQEHWPLDYQSMFRAGHAIHEYLQALEDEGGGRFVPRDCCEGDA